MTRAQLDERTLKDLMDYCRALMNAKVDLPPGSEEMDEELQEAIRQAVRFVLVLGTIDYTLAAQVHDLMVKKGPEYLAAMREYATMDRSKLH